MKKPIIYSIDDAGNNAPIFAQGDYDVFVGALEADKLPQYVVINRATNVVEYTSEVTLGYLSWLDGIAEASANRNLALANPGTDPEQLPLSLSFTN